MSVTIGNDVSDEQRAAMKLGEAWMTPFVRKLPSGEWACVHRFIYTAGLLVGAEVTGYRTRFCYEEIGDAVAALATWDGTGDPPGPWIKEKGGIERSNPLRFKGIEIVQENTNGS